MRTIAIATQKGGTGKSTTAVNLAAALAERGRRVLLVDTDPQCNASMWLGVRDTGRGLFDVFTERAALAALVRSTAVKGLDIVAASPWLVGLDKALANEPGAEGILRAALAALPRPYDYALVDTPPNLGLPTINALAAAGEVLVPVEPHAAAVAGLAQLMQTVNLVRERINPALELAGILVCKAQLRTRHSQDVIAMLRARHGRDVFKTVIRYSVKVAEAWSFQKPITEYDSRGTVAADYRAAAAELMRREKKT